MLEMSDMNIHKHSWTFTIQQHSQLKINVAVY